MMKNFKAPGFDEITNEDIKLIEHLKPDLIHTVLECIWEPEIYPDEFANQLFIYSKPANQANKRTIATKRITVLFLYFQC